MGNLSSRASRLTGQPMFNLIDRAKKLEAAGKSIVHLEIGDPDFSTPPNISKAAITAIESGDTHYVSSWGIPELIEAVQAATLRSRGFEPETRQVLITPGANIAVYYAAFVVANAGDEILVPDPGFPTYLAAIDMCGATAVPYRLDKANGFSIDVEQIKKSITKKTKMIIVTSPNNPTGSLADEQQLRAVFELAAEHDLVIFSDEIYSRMIYRKQDFFSISSLDSCKNRVILSNGFSKAFAMTGWRLGTVVAPEEIAEKMMLVLQTTSSCVSPFIQRAGLEAITGDQSDTRNMMGEYRRRRDRVVDTLNSIDGVTCPVPGGSFYAFPDISGIGLSSQEFAERLLEEQGVALLPGTDFGENGEGHVRISFATSQENLSEGLTRIKRFASRIGI